MDTLGVLGGLETLELRSSISRTLPNNTATGAAVDFGRSQDRYNDLRGTADLVCGKSPLQHTRIVLISYLHHVIFVLFFF